MSTTGQQEPKPVGLFGMITGQSSFAALIDKVSSLVGVLGGNAAAAAEYLRSGTVVLALMEQTTDIIGSRFKTLGGSAILTDGYFYWRRDTADYVNHYAVGLPEDFVEHMRRLSWICPTVSPERVLEVDRFLMEKRAP